MTELRKAILELMPTNPEDAIRKDVIAEQIGECLSTVSNEIKSMRLTGIPILWCREGVYIDYNTNAISRMKRIVNNMKEGYYQGMTNIHTAYTAVQEGSYDGEALDFLRQRDE